MRGAHSLHVHSGFAQLHGLGFIQLHGRVPGSPDPCALASIQVSSPVQGHPSASATHLERCAHVLGAHKGAQLLGVHGVEGLQGSATEEAQVSAAPRAIRPAVTISEQPPGCNKEPAAHSCQPKKACARDTSSKYGSHLTPHRPTHLREAKGMLVLPPQPAYPTRYPATQPNKPQAHKATATATRAQATQEAHLGEELRELGLLILAHGLALLCSRSLHVSQRLLQGVLACTWAVQASGTGGSTGQRRAASGYGRAGAVTGADEWCLIVGHPWWGGHLLAISQLQWMVACFGRTQYKQAVHRSTWAWGGCYVG